MPALNLAAKNNRLTGQQNNQKGSAFLSVLFLFTLSLFFTGQVAAQTFNPDLWISPDIPKASAATANKTAKPMLPSFSSAARIASSANPDIPGSLLCQDLRVVFVLDESGSLTGTEITSVEDGARALANALLNSGATLRIVEFNTRSSIVDLGVTEVNSTFITRLNSYLGAGYNSQNYNPVSSGSCTGWTNWEDALQDVATLDADLVIFFTDGNPTAYNVLSGGDCFGTVNTGVTGDPSLDPAITQANLLKSQGKHLFVVGVGNSNEINLDNIKAISGEDVFGPGHDILTADYTTPPFDALAENLTGAVNSICGTELLVNKDVSNSGVCAGETVVFTNTVINTGGEFNFTAINVNVQDVYPNGYSNLVLLAPIPAGAVISGGNTVNIPVGDMIAGQSITYQVRATVDAPPGNYNNVITATAFNANEVTDNESVISGYATAEIDFTACEPVTVNNVEYTTPGTYTQTLVSAAGCDSILTIVITGGKPSTATETIIACGMYEWKGVTYTESNNTATWTGTNAAGCDSVVTLDLTINQPSASTEKINACNSYIWHGETYTESTNFATWIGTNAAGCDSVVTLDLTINQPSSSTETVVACSSYTWHGETFTESNNTATWTGTNAAGCDSVVTLDLTINLPSASTETVVACSSYTWHGETYTESNNTATWIGTNAAGCDSVVTLDLTINQPSASTETVVACSTYTWHGETFTASNNTATWTGTNAAGCDSIVTLDLTINQPSFSTETIFACGAYIWHGETYTASNNTATWIGTNAAGCDSVVTLDLTIGRQVFTTETIFACGSYTWHGETFTESNNTATWTGTNVDGCDSIVTLNLTIGKPSASTETIVACSSYTWHGTLYTASNSTDTWTGTNAAGCDSVVTLNLTINQPSASTETVFACGPYEWHGETYSVSNTTATWTGTNAAGCDSVVTLNLTVGKPSWSTETVTACGSYVWHGTTYTSNNTTATWIGTNAAGCDSTVTLNLTITARPVLGPINCPAVICRNQTGVQFSVAAVNGASSYTWILPSGVTGSSTTNTIVVSIGSAFTSGIVKVYANTSCGTSNTSQKTISSITAPPAIPGSISGPVTACSAGDYTYSIAAVAGATSYLWTVTGTGATIISGQGTTSIVVRATSSFRSGSITVKAVNCIGSCTSKTLNVFASVIVCTKGSISGPTTGLCKKTGVVFSIPAVTGATSYVWTVPAGATITAGANTNTITVSFGASFVGTGTITVKAKNACGTCSKATSLTVTALTAMPGAITGSSAVSRSQTAVVYSIPVVTGATSYSWTITGGARVVGSAAGRTVTINFSTATASTAVISVVANNACGCSAPVKKTITVSSTASRPSNPAITKDDGIELPQYSVYPNPTSGLFNISFKANENDKIAIDIVDAYGKVLLKSVKVYTAGYQTTQVNIARFAKGVYYAHIWRNGKEEKTVQVLKQ